MTADEFDTLNRKLQQLERGLSCAIRILELLDNHEYGVTVESRLGAVEDVLRVARLRSEGGNDTVSKDTERVMRLILADIEVRALWDRLGLTHWSPN